MWYFHSAACALLVVMLVKGVASQCKMADAECEYYLTVTQHLTMMKGTYAVFPFEGKLYKYDVEDTSTATPEDEDGIIQADGNEQQRLVTIANGTMPGPTIEAYEGQTLVVHVTNHLANEALSIHWHGMHQKGTPFMDGVAFITQCPLLPEQTFTYRFKAKPKGTFWYHSHLGDQRTMGLFGPLIIREKKPMEIEEHILSLQDWNQDDATSVFIKMNIGGFEDRKQMNTTMSYDGSKFSRFFMKSALINGKGRLYYSFGGHNGAPLSVFKVEQGKQYRFRVIAAGHLYPFRLSIDQHELAIVASDGYELQPKMAESFIINPGERLDFIISANQTVGNYWIRAQTLEIDVDHRVEAILRYEGASDEEPTTRRRSCTEDNPCEVINCPFSYFPLAFTICTRFDQLKSLADDPAPAVVEGKFKEHFLNFAFPGLKHYPGQVNGHKFKMPGVSALHQMDEVESTCDKVDCGEDKTCYCTYTLELNHMDTVQMVFLNIGNGKGWNHPIHLHGHSFYVLKMGYAQYNSTTGKIIGDNLDIDCGNTTHNFCNDGKWANKSWGGDNIPGLEMKNPPRKDTIIVPTGGYVIVRIRADNPGLWFMHCHIEMHAQDGMAMVVNEAPDQYPRVPDNFPRCSSFDGKVTPEPEVKPEPKGKDMMFSHDIFWTVVGCLIGLCTIQFIIIFCMCLRRCEGSGREKYAVKTPQPQINQSFEKY